MSRGTSFFASIYIMPMGDAYASRMRVASSATRGTTLIASSAASKLQNEVLLNIASQRNVSAALVAAPSAVESLLFERRIDCTICDTRAALSRLRVPPTTPLKKAMVRCARRGWRRQALTESARSLRWRWRECRR
eukprot:358027-Pleurochrysis_carterae.AAC.1